MQETRPFVPKEWRSFRTWLEKPLGQYFRQQEALAIQKILPNTFGYHLLVLGEPIFGESLADSRIPHKIVCHPEITEVTGLSALKARQDKLPILSESMDTIYLAHSLEFMQNPHEVLREAYRTLTPEGYLILSALNPWSIWGIWRMVMGLSGRAPWCGRFMSSLKLHDWLALLGFDMIRFTGFAYKLPIHSSRYLSKNTWYERFGQTYLKQFGAGLLVIAQKRNVTLTPIKPRWRAKRPITVADIASPTTRASERFQK